MGEEKSQRIIQGQKKYQAKPMLSMKKSGFIPTSESYYKMQYKEDMGRICLITRHTNEPITGLLQKSRQQMMMS